MATTPATQELGPVRAEELLSRQPPVRLVTRAMAAIRDTVVRQGTCIAVLDDDPTGTQSVHGVTVLTTWETGALRAALTHPSRTFFVLTNSRSRSRPEAAAISKTIATRLADLADELGIGVQVLSRSDSTLRGHFPTEIDALQQGFDERGWRHDGVIICPCFLEVGRVTVDDVHWVRDGNQFVPAADTEFAADATFGYQSSNLRAWVEEKSNGAIPVAEVRSISLADIRNGGPRRVAELLQELAGRAVVVNAASYADLEIFVLGLLEVEAAGLRFLYRTGPSFVRVRAGIEAKPVLGPGEIYRDGDRPGSGLVVVGSHAALSTRQLEAAMALGDLHPVELSVPHLLGAGREDEIDRIVEEIAAAARLRRGAVHQPSAGPHRRSGGEPRAQPVGVERSGRRRRTPRPEPTITLPRRQGWDHVQRHRHRRPWRSPGRGGRSAAPRRRIGVVARRRQRLPRTALRDLSGQRGYRRYARPRREHPARGTQHMTLERVGFIGLGAMGAPMAARLVAVVGTLTVFDPVAERRQSLADRGAVSAQSPLQAAREADALFVMVVNEVQCEEALFGSEGAVAALPKNAVIVIMSTVGPQVVRGLAERLHRREVQLVDAPVSGGVARAGAGDLLIMASGPASALDVVRPALTRMGSTVIDCGVAAGDGQAVKLVNQLLCGVHIAAAGEALGYARALGLSPAAVYETIRHGAAGSFMLEDRGARMLSREFTPAKSALEIFVKDLGLVTETAAGRRFPTPLAATANQLFLIGAAAGYSGEDDSGIVRVFEQWVNESSA